MTFENPVPKACDAWAAVAVTGVGEDLAEARRRAYEGAALITFEGRVMRSDIALAVA